MSAGRVIHSDTLIIKYAQRHCETFSTNTCEYTTKKLKQQTETKLNYSIVFAIQISSDIWSS